MVKLRVNVTQDDIDKGCRKRRSKCPIARAVNRVVHEATGNTKFGAMVGYTAILVGDAEGEIIRVAADRRIQQFIFYFDNEMPVKPFNFTIAVSDATGNSVIL